MPAPKGPATICLPIAVLSDVHGNLLEAVLTDVTAQK